MVRDREIVGSEEPGDKEFDRIKNEVAYSKLVENEIPKNIGNLSRVIDTIRLALKWKDFSKLSQNRIEAERLLKVLKVNFRSAEIIASKGVHSSHRPTGLSQILVLRNQVSAEIAEFLAIASEIESSNLSSTRSRVVAVEVEAGTRVSSAHGYDQIEEAPTEASEESIDHKDTLETLANSASEVKEIMKDLLGVIKSSGEGIQCISDSVDRSLVTIESAKSELTACQKIKASIIPLSGAVVGCLIAGPVGLVVVGVKVGLVSLIAGGTFGLLGGKMIKNSILKRLK